MRDKIKEKILLIQYVALIIALVVMIAGNIDNSLFWFIVLLSAIVMISFSLRNLFFYNFEKLKRISGFIIVSDIILSFIIILMDKGAGSVIFLYIVISDVIINFSFVLGLFSALFCFSLYAVNQKLTLGNAEALSIATNLFKGLIPFIVILVFLYIVKYIMKQNEIIDITLKKLTAKTIEQEMTLEELKEAYDKQEDITILKERNKIAREIHDTLGHTLTTVLVETEAGKILLHKDKEEALRKFDLAQEQLRKGLEDLRLSVRLLDKGHELVDLKTSLESLIKDVEKHTGVIIKYDISLNGEPDISLRKTLYRALQEGITNGIKHGGSTVFVFKLGMNDRGIDFLLQDNGKGCSAIIPGYGLRAMQERIKEFGGIVDVESEPEEGFTLKIHITLDGRDVLNE